MHLHRFCGADTAIAVINMYSASKSAKIIAKLPPNNSFATKSTLSDAEINNTPALHKISSTKY